jgi:hypothetical protein
MTDVVDQRPVVDYIWFHEDSLRLFNVAELRLIAQHRPLGTEGEPWPWKSELSVAPWVVYVLASAISLNLNVACSGRGNALAMVF